MSRVENFNDFDTESIIDLKCLDQCFKYIVYIVVIVGVIWGLVLRFDQLSGQESIENKFDLLIASSLRVEDKLDQLINTTLSIENAIITCFENITLCLDL